MRGAPRLRRPRSGWRPPRKAPRFLKSSQLSEPLPSMARFIGLREFFDDALEETAGLRDVPLLGIGSTLFQERRRDLVALRVIGDQPLVTVDRRSVLFLVEVGLADPVPGMSRKAGRRKLTQKVLKLSHGKVVVAVQIIIVGEIVRRGLRDGARAVGWPRGLAHILCRRLSDRILGPEGLQFGLRAKPRELLLENLHPSREIALSLLGGSLQLLLQLAVFGLHIPDVFPQRSEIRCMDAAGHQHGSRPARQVCTRSEARWF